MKQSIRIFSVILAVFAFSALSRAEGPGDDWQKKMMAEKVAFFTVEMDLSPAEAEKFWPLYNKYEAARNTAFEATGRTYKDLMDALAQDKSAKIIESLLDKYIAAQNSLSKVATESAASFKKVLPAIKVAKMYVAEEKFRRQQISRLHRR